MHARRAYVYSRRSRDGAQRRTSAPATRPGALPPTSDSARLLWVLAGFNDGVATGSVYPFYSASSRACALACASRSTCSCPLRFGFGIENSKDSRSEDHSTLRKCHVWQLASARPYYLRSYPRPLPIPRKLSGEIAEGQRGAADHQRDFRDRWHFCRMDPVTEGRQCAEGPAPPLPWPWSRTRRQRRLRRRWKLCLACSVRL